MKMVYIDDHEEWSIQCHPSDEDEWFVNSGKWTTQSMEYYFIPDGAILEGM